MKIEAQGKFEGFTLYREKTVVTLFTASLKNRKQGIEFITKKIKNSSIHWKRWSKN